MQQTNILQDCDGVLFLELSPNPRCTDVVLELIPYTWPVVQNGVEVPSTTIVMPIGATATASP